MATLYFPRPDVVSRCGLRRHRPRTAPRPDRRLPGRGHRRRRRSVQDDGGLFEEFGKTRIWDTPISEQAILGVAMGAAMAGYRPMAEIMFSDFFACCWDYLANEIPKMRYMTGGQVTVPLVVRTANGGRWASAPSTPRPSRTGPQHPGPQDRGAVESGRCGRHDGIGDPQRRPGGLLRAQRPVRQQGRPAPPKGHVIELGQAAIARAGTDVTVVALAATVPMALAAAEQLAAEGISAEVIDLRCLVPLDMQTVLGSVERTSRLVSSRKTLPGRLGRHSGLDRRRRGLRDARRPDPPGRGRLRPPPVRRRAGRPGNPDHRQGRTAIRKLAAY